MMNAVRLAAQKAVELKIWMRLGEVTGVNPATYTAKVRIQPDGFETGWLPIGSDAVGDGWGIFALPAPGDLVQVTFQGDWDAGVVTTRFFNRKNRPTAGLAAGEFLLEHKSGSRLRFHANGDVQLDVAQNLNVTVGGDLNATVEGDVVVGATGNAQVTAPGGCIVTGNLGVAGTIKATGTITPTTSVP